MSQGRCGVHGLIAGADGRCVICRRGESEEVEKTSSDWPVVVFALVMGVGVVGALGYWVFKPKPHDELPVQEAVIAPAPTETPRQTPVRDPANRTPIRRTEEPPPIASVVAPAGPSREEIDAAKKRIRVVMYSGNACSLCDRARLYLNQQGNPLHELNIDASPTDKVVLKSVNPAGTVPTFDVEGKILVGYDRQVLDKTIEGLALARMSR